MSTPKFCMECGTSLNAGAKFCASCGAKAEAPAAAAAAPEPANAEAPKVEPVKVEPVKAKAEPAKDERPGAPSLEAAPPAAAKKPAAEAPAPKRAAVAALIASDDDDDEEQLAMPAGQSEGGEKAPKPIGMYVMIGFVVALIAAGVFIGSNEELNARFRCNVLGNKTACITEEDRMFEIEQAEKKEEIELMAHHYGGFDLSFTPENETSFTIRQHRYEESRADFVKRIREGGVDNRKRKVTKVGVYSEKKLPDGVIKGTVAFSADAAAAVTYQPVQGKSLVLPLALPELPLLEREQVDGNDKPLSIDDIAAIEKAKEAGGANAPKKAELKVRTVAISTWVYEIELSATGYKPRKVFFYEAPVPADLDVKKLEAEGNAARAFKRRPDGRFVIDNANFDLVPEPRTLWTRYIQAQKEIYCLQQSTEYKGKSDQGKTDAEALLWEQKAFTKELLDIAHQNDEDPEWMKYKEEQFKGYACPKL